MVVPDPPLVPEFQGSGAFWNFARHRLLVVDDEVNLQDLYGMALSAEGISITSCGDGRSALDEIGRREFDLLLLDLRMPGIGGLEVLQRIRDAGDLTPAVICTAELSIQAFLRGVRQGVAVFLRKPLSIMTLRRAVHEQLRDLASSRFGAAFRELGKLEFARAAEMMDRVLGARENRPLREWRNLCEGIDQGLSDERLESTARAIISTGLAIPYEV